MSEAEARQDIDRRAALAVLADEELGTRPPVLWLLRDALDRYAEAAQSSQRDDYFGCELVDGVSLRSVIALHRDDRCVSVEKGQDGALYGQQAPQAALTLFDRLVDREFPPVVLNYKRTVEVLDRIEEAITTVS